MGLLGLTLTSFQHTHANVTKRLRSL